MSKCCNDCIFYRPASDKATCGRCDYPVPEWLKNGASGGGFISSELYTGADCDTFKNRKSLIGKEAKKE